MQISNKHDYIMKFLNKNSKEAEDELWQYHNIWKLIYWSEFYTSSQKLLYHDNRQYKLDTLTFDLWIVKTPSSEYFVVLFIPGVHISWVVTTYPFIWLSS